MSTIQQCWIVDRFTRAAVVSEASGRFGVVGRLGLLSALQAANLVNKRFKPQPSSWCAAGRHVEDMREPAMRRVFRDGWYPEPFGQTMAVDDTAELGVGLALWRRGDPLARTDVSEHLVGFYADEHDQAGAIASRRLAAPPVVLADMLTLGRLVALGGPLRFVSHSLEAERLGFSPL